MNPQTEELKLNNVKDLRIHILNLCCNGYLKGLNKKELNQILNLLIK